MKVIDQTTLPADVIGRVTVGEYNGHEYVYFFVVNTCIRYEVNKGQLTLDSTWNPGTLLVSGQTAGWALVVLHDWVVGQCNGLPASTPLSVFAVNQGDASKQFMIQPFAGDPIPPLVKAAFSKQAPGGTQAISWNAATVSVDPQSNLIYAMDALPGEIAAVHLSSSGLQTAWKVAQTTTEFIAIIGPPDQRVIVGFEHSRSRDSGYQHGGRGRVAERSDGSGDRAVGAVAGYDVRDDGPAVLLRRYVLSERGRITVQAPAGSRWL